jgi:hypothetical protein
MILKNFDCFKVRLRLKLNDPLSERYLTYNCQLASLPVTYFLNSRRFCPTADIFSFFFRSTQVTAAHILTSIMPEVAKVRNTLKFLCLYPIFNLLVIFFYNTPQISLGFYWIRSFKCHVYFFRNKEPCARLKILFILLVKFQAK